MREFSREPEAWLWTYGFPVLMAVALGIAFRNQGVPEIAVAVVENPQAKATRDAGDASGGQDGGDRDAELAQHQRPGNDDDHDRCGVAKDARQRFDARPLVEVRRLRLHVAPENPDQAVDDRLQDPGDREDQHDAQRGDRGALRLGVELAEVGEQLLHGLADNLEAHA